MNEAEAQRLRERVASGEASDDEIDRLAVTLAAGVRSRGPRLVGAREAELAELVALVAAHPRPACVEALLSARLDSQIRAYERRDGEDAWRQLDHVRAWAIRAPDSPVVADRFAAALFNGFRGGVLLGDEAMRLAALAELRTHARSPGAAGLACRVALAELLADAVAAGWRRDEPRGFAVERALAELEQLAAAAEVDVVRELARAWRELGFGRVRAHDEVLARLEALRERSGGDLGVTRHLAEILVVVHADALADELGDELGAENVRERLRVLAHASGEANELVHELGKALHDAALLAHVRLESSGSDGDEDRSTRALAELRALVHRHEHDLTLRGQLMSALAQIHRNTIERSDALAAERESDDEGAGELDGGLAAERLQAEADALLALADTSPPAAGKRAQQLELALRLDYLRMLLASHALAGDRGDWLHAERLLVRARELVERTGAPLALLEVFGQMLVNAHVDAGARAVDEPPTHGQDPAERLLVELRERARKNPHSGGLQVQLATALFNAHVEAGRRETRAAAERLLTELDRLHREHPGLLELRRRLVMALVNHHGDALEREDFARASAVLDRVRALVRSPDADNHLRVQLAMALGNTLAHVDDPACGEDDARIVGELRVLAAREDASESLRALVLDELSDRFAPRQ